MEIMKDMADQRTPLSSTDHADLVVFMAHRSSREDLPLLDRVCNYILKLESDTQGLSNEFSETASELERVRHLAYEMTMRALDSNHPTTVSLDDIVEHSRRLGIAPEEIVANMVGKAIE